MNCCTECFNSPFIKNVISKPAEKGDCVYCKARDVNVFKADNLDVFFKSLFDLYSVVEKNDYIGGTNYFPAPLDNIVKQLEADFPSLIFSKKVIDKNALLQAILINYLSEYQAFFNQKVRLSFLLEFDPDFDPFHNEWSKFVEEIKHRNRFHIDSSLDLKRLDKVFNWYVANISQGTQFYRARICDGNNGFDLSEMCNPPNQYASSGRANPEGISYLYLASDIETTLHEARASLFDTVSVATFDAIEDFKIIDLRGGEHTPDPVQMADDESLEQFLRERAIITELQNVLAKPKRRGDSNLDYLPTQYICEYIKFLGYKGIKFRSTLNKSGFNLAIFEPELFEGKEVKHYEISSSSLDYAVKDEENFF